MGSFSIGGVHEFEIAATKLGWRAEDLDRLTKSEKLCGDVLKVLRGQAEIILVRRAVDCSAPAWCPDNWVVAPEEEQIASRFRGDFDLTLEALALHSDPGRQGDGVAGGAAFRTALAGTPVLPANVLDCLLEHQELIPESWKVKAVFFWGTVYRGPNGYLCVRYLFWDGVRWCWDCDWLELSWRSRGPAAVPAI